MATNFEYYFDQIMDLERSRLASPAAQPARGMPSAATTQEDTPKSGPLGPETEEQRAFNYGVRQGVAPVATNTIDRVSTGTIGSSGLNAFGLSGPETEEKLFRMGTARVPGKGDGTKDTVKAKLAPGEAVLNKAAADKMGRGLIAALNKMGAQKMGLV